VAINLAPRSSYLADGTATIAFGGFAVFYVIAALVTLRIYLRRPSQKIAEQPVLAAAGA
jgi:NNP family nitrate/nitrite transporter-like MFS transporter